jgi:hypothetical protein
VSIIATEGSRSESGTLIGVGRGYEDYEFLGYTDKELEELLSEGGTSEEDA